MAPIVERGAIGTFTKEILVANAHRPWARAHMLGRNLPTTSHFRPGFPDEWENFRAIWKRDFDRVGGFDEVGHGEDVTLGRKLGRLAVAAQGATCYHHEPDTLRDIFLSGRWVGRGERIKELPRVGQRAFVLRSLRLSLGLARRHRMPSLALYRMVYDGGVLVGLLTRGRGGSGR